jgi:hypothetical protein
MRRNLGITTGVLEVLKQADAPLSPSQITKRLSMPEGWTYDKLRANVTAILANERTNRIIDPRWERVRQGAYVYRRTTWVEAGIRIFHKHTGAIRVVKQKAFREKEETASNRWIVSTEDGEKSWAVHTRNLEVYWEQVK